MDGSRVWRGEAAVIWVSGVGGFVLGGVVDGEEEDWGWEVRQGVMWYVSGKNFETDISKSEIKCHKGWR
jgi:hypothetical protein